MRRILLTAPGPASSMAIEDVPRLSPPADGVVVDVEAAGVNFIDTYQRSGVYEVPMPFTPGLEGAGIVTETGADVTWVRPGDRVAWCYTGQSYAEQVVLREDDCYRVPSGVTLETAAALMLQGLTAHYLVTSVFSLGADHTALVHAGAGGVGLLLTQLARARGARVISTVSTAAKAERSRAAGAAEVIRYDDFTDMATDLPAAVRDLTAGEGVDVVYDGVGAATFDGSLASLAVRGTLALFGGASGQVPPVDLQRLNHAGSLFVTRPSLGHFLRTREEREWRARELFGSVESGELDVAIGARYPLESASAAHEDLEGRRVMGKALLLPGATELSHSA